MKHLPFLCLLAALLMPVSLLAAEGPDTVVIIVGNNVDLRPDRPRHLSYADDDAASHALTYRTVTENSVHLLVGPDPTVAHRLTMAGIEPDGHPTLSQWRAQLDAATVEVARAKAAGRRAHVIFHFSGHGLTSGTLTFQDQYLQPAQLRDDLASLNADIVIAILDGCYAGNFARGDDDDQPEANNSASSPQEKQAKESTLIALPEGIQPPWLGVIGATTTVPEYTSLHGGLLSTVSAAGLRGLADTDQNYRVDFNELEAFFYHQLADAEGGRRIGLFTFRPLVDSRPEMVDFRRGGLMRLVIAPTAPVGHVRINRVLADRTEEPILAYYRPPQDTIRHLFLPPGSYEITATYVERTEDGGQVYKMRRAQVETKEGATDFITHDTFGPPVDAADPNAKASLEDPNAAVVPSDALWILSNSPWARAPLLSRSQHPPSLSFAVSATHPWTGPALDELSDTARPGGSFALRYMQALGDRGRWAVGAGGYAGYGLHVEDENPERPWLDSFQTAYRHDLEAGLIAQEMWMWRRLHLGVEQHIGWSPFAYHLYKGEGISPLYRYPKAIHLGGAALISTPLTRKLELGLRVAGGYQWAVWALSDNENGPTLSAGFFLQQQWDRSVK